SVNLKCGLMLLSLRSMSQIVIVIRCLMYKRTKKNLVFFTNSVKHVKPSRVNIKETGTTNCSPKIEKQERNGHTRKGLGYAFTRKACFVCGSFSHLIRDCDFYEKRMAKQAELTKSMNKVTGQRENRPVWNTVQRVNHQNKFVPSVLLTKTDKFLVNAARQNYFRQAASTSTASKVNTARPFVNETRPKRNFYKTHSPHKRPFHNTTTQRPTFSYQKVNVFGNKSLSVVEGNGNTAVKASADCNWRYKRNSWNKVSNYNSGSKLRKSDDLHRDLKDKGIVDSICSRHMTGNKAHLVDYQEFKGGSVAFGGSNGRITGKGKIKTGSFNLKNINPSGDLACLFVKVSIDESNKWHRRLGHVNFKNLNKLVKGSLVRGLPSKIFENDHTYVACQKGKQHNASEIDLNKEHFILPIWSAYSTTIKSLRDKIKKNSGFKTCEKPISQVEQVFLEELEKLKRQEKEAYNAAKSLRKEATHDIKNANTSSTNLINSASTPLSTAGPSRAFNDGELSYPDPSRYVLLDDPSMPHLEDIYDSPSEGIFTDSSYDNEGVVTDFNNLETTVSVSLTPTIRIHTIHPKTQILRDPKLAVQTKSKVNKNSEAHALKVQILVDLPFGKKAIGTKRVYKNKKDERGVVVKNKARLVSHGHRQEEGIDYDEVFAIVARIKAIRIFLAFASYMGFIVYEMDVKSAFLYGTIDE
nr:putative ribonuclease H-like domain-containing protein [Tanacetum cinerariifolium]